MPFIAAFNSLNNDHHTDIFIPKLKDITNNEGSTLVDSNSASTLVFTKEKDDSGISVNPNKLYRSTITTSKEQITFNFSTVNSNNDTPERLHIVNVSDKVWRDMIASDITYTNCSSTGTELTINANKYDYTLVVTTSGHTQNGKTPSSIVFSSTNQTKLLDKNSNPLATDFKIEWYPDHTRAIFKILSNTEAEARGRDESSGDTLYDDYGITHSPAGKGFRERDIRIRVNKEMINSEFPGTWDSAGYVYKNSQGHITIQLKTYDGSNWVDITGTPIQHVYISGNLNSNGLVTNNSSTTNGPIIGPLHINSGFYTSPNDYYEYVCRVSTDPGVKWRLVVYDGKLHDNAGNISNATYTDGFNYTEWQFAETIAFMTLGQYNNNIYADWSGKNYDINSILVDPDNYSVPLNTSNNHNLNTIISGYNTLRTISTTASGENLLHIMVQFQNEVESGGNANYQEKSNVARVPEGTDNETDYNNNIKEVIICFVFLIKMIHQIFQIIKI